MLKVSSLGSTAQARPVPDGPPHIDAGRSPILATCGAPRKPTPRADVHRQQNGPAAEATGPFCCAVRTTYSAVPGVAAVEATAAAADAEVSP